MFGPRTYWRLFELHNTAWRTAPPAWLRGVAAALALALGWAFVAHLYGQVHAGRVFVPLCERHTASDAQSEDCVALKV